MKWGGGGGGKGELSFLSVLSASQFSAYVSFFFRLFCVILF